MPFPIRLDERCRADCIIQRMRIKLDPGCKVTGTAVVHEGNANGAALRRHAVARFLAELTPTEPMSQAHAKPETGSPIPSWKRWLHEMP